MFKATAPAALVCALTVLASLAFPRQDDAVSDDPPPVTLGEDTTAFLDAMLRSSQIQWPDRMDAARASLAENPRAVIGHLVASLAHDEGVPGEWLESQSYNVCGNALTLLELLTDERICGLGSDWIGFSTHDHRSTSPSDGDVQGPWTTWLQVRESVPAGEWFWGLSYAEIQRISPLMRVPEAEWKASTLEAVTKLGPRAYPYLIDKLVDDQYATRDRQFCAQANAFLRRLTGKDVGRIDRTELLSLDPEDPDRKLRLAVHRNRSSMQLVQRRWMAALLGR